MDTLFNNIMIKIASATYGTNVASAREYTPKSRTIQPQMVTINTGTAVSQPSIPTNEKDDIPQPGSNRYWNPNGYPTWRFTHSFAPTVSGTGGGRQYWTQSRNPYEC